MRPALYLLQKIACFSRQSLRHKMMLCPEKRIVVKPWMVKLTINSNTRLRKVFQVNKNQMIILPYALYVATPTVQSAKQLLAPSKRFNASHLHSSFSPMLPSFPHLQIRFVLCPAQRLSYLFSFKDKIPKNLKSRVMYYFKCRCCSASCEGQKGQSFAHTSF